MTEFENLNSVLIPDKNFVINDFLKFHQTVFIATPVESERAAVLSFGSLQIHWTILLKLAIGNPPDTIQCQHSYHAKFWQSNAFSDTLSSFTFRSIKQQGFWGVDSLMIHSGLPLCNCHVCFSVFIQFLVGFFFLHPLFCVLLLCDLKYGHNFMGAFLFVSMWLVMWN